MYKHYCKVNINLDTTEGECTFLYKDDDREKTKAFFGQYLQIKVLFSKVTSELPKPGREVWLMNCDA